jgi:hypothetical protein
MAQAVQASQVVSTGQTQGAGAPSSGSPATSEVGGSVSSGAVAGDYAMAILAKITHASADQALALLTAMTTQSPTALSYAASGSGPAMVDPLWGRRA